MSVSAIQARDYAMIRTVEEAQALADKLLADGTLIGFDVETGYSGPDVEKRALNTTHPDQFVVGFSITNSPTWARYLPLRHDMQDNLPAKEVWEIFRPVLEQLDIVAHHKKFEDKNLRMLGIKGDANGPILTKRGHDTMLDAYVLSEWQGKQGGDGILSATGLKTLTQAVLKVDQKDLWSLFPQKADGKPDLTQKQMKSIRFNVLALTTDVISYACEDAALCLELHFAINAKAAEQRGLILSLELLISEIMAEVETYGVGIDWVGLAKAYEQYPVFKAKLESSVKAGFSVMVGKDQTSLNLASTKQLSKLLFEDLGLKTTRTTDKGAPSTDEIALEALSREHPTIQKLLELRQVTNLGKRLDKWLSEYRGHYDGRVHANFAQTVVGTGRFAANDPAIQQCPKDWRWSIEHGDVWGPAWEKMLACTEEGVSRWSGNFREFIVADPGNYLLTFDYSQIELRVMAGVSGEQMLLDAFANGVDVHSLTAAMMLGKRVEDIDPKTERPIGKTTNFALLYQMGQQSLAERMGVSRDRANELYAEYFRQFTSVTTWMERAKRDGMRVRYAETCFGRKNTVWELYSTNQRVFKKGERILINAPIQGGAADYMKLAMVRCRKVLLERGWWGKGVMITMNQHDALTFECSNRIDPNELKAVLQDAVVFDPKSMVKAFAYQFPKIVADWELGQTWGGSKAWKKDKEARWDGEVWALYDVTAEAIPCTRTRTSVVYRSPLHPLSMEELPEQPAAPITPLSSGTTRSETPTAPAAGSLRTTPLHVHIEEMPDEDHLFRLVKLIEASPGMRPVLLSTPEGEVELPFKTSLGIEDKGKISLAIGGAAVYEPADDENLSALAAAMDF